ncbi:MAG: cyclic nucleotide-binding/CBS domain-containing protein [Acidimicrobiales bacterium]
MNASGDNVTATTRTVTVVRPSQMPTGSLVGKPPVKADSASPIGEVAQAMRDANASLVLISTGPAAGPPRVVTEHDLVLALAEGLCPTDPVSRVTSHDGAVVAPGTKLADVADSLLRDDATCVLVVDHGEVTGTLSAKDVLAALVASWASRERPGPGPDATSELWLG